jgi:hypothetical protein
MSDVTFFLTSYKRHDLLKTCLETFVQHNTYPIEHGIIVENSDLDLEWIRDILPFKRLDLIHCPNQYHQIHKIDAYYPTIQTPYVFHCDADMEFYRDGFIEPSKRIMEHDPWCINVWLSRYERSWEVSLQPENLTYANRVIPPYHRQYRLDDITYWPVNNCMHGEWGLGFTFQPSLHRMEDWSRYGGYESILQRVAPWVNRMDGGQVERNLCRHYIMEGFHTRMLAGPGDKEEGYVRDVG